VSARAARAIEYGIASVLLACVSQVVMVVIPNMWRPGYSPAWMFIVPLLLFAVAHVFATIATRQLRFGWLFFIPIVAIWALSLAAIFNLL
jgi:hypothetical protein